VGEEELRAAAGAGACVCGRQQAGGPTWPRG